MALDNYVNLQAAIGDWLNRADLAAVIPDFIALCEDDLSTELRDRQETSTQLSTVAAQGTLPLPADVQQLTSLSIAAINGSPVGKGGLTATTPELIDYYRSLAYAPAQPRYFAILATSGQPTLLLAPVPDRVYALNAVYNALLTPLAQAVGGMNWVLTNHPNVYLYGALLHSAPYLKEDDRVDLWEKRYDKALEKLRIDAERLKYGTNTLVARPKRPIGG